MEQAKSLWQMSADLVINKKLPVTVFLVNGVKLQGVITAADDRSLILTRDNHMQLVERQAVSTIMPVEAGGLAA